MKYQINPLVTVISLVTSSFVLADEPQVSNPNNATIQYQGGKTNAPIVELSGHTGKNNLIIKDVTITDIDESKLTSMSEKALISLGGNNGSFAGLAPEHQQYGNLEATLNKDTEIIANLTSTDSIIGVYSRTDSADGTNTISSDATINITSTGLVIGISSENFSGSSGNGEGGKAILHLGQNSNITVSGVGSGSNAETVAAQATGDKASIIADKGSSINVNGQKDSYKLVGLKAWGYNNTASITNNGNIKIDGTASQYASSVGIDSSSLNDNFIIHQGNISIIGGGSNTGIKGFSQNGTNYIHTSKDSIIDINSPTAYANKGIDAYGDNNLEILGDISVEGLAATGISTDAGTSIINHSGNITAKGQNVSIGIHVIGINDTDNESHIYSSGNIEVSAADSATGIYSAVYGISNIVYDNTLGHVKASSSTTPPSSYSAPAGIMNMSITSDANTIIKNADYISAISTTGDDTSRSTVIYNVSMAGNSYVGITNTNQIKASSANGSAIGISSLVSNGSGKTQIDLSNVKTVSADGVAEVQTISAQNQGSGDTLINIANNVSQIASTATGNTGINAGIYATSNEGNTIITSAAKNITTSGFKNHGILAKSEKGNVQISTSSHISAAGNNSSGIYSSTNDGSNKVTLASGANVQGGSGDQSLASGIIMTSQAGEQELHISTGATVSSLNDSAIYSTNASGKTTVNNFGTITGYATLTGNDVTFNNSGTINLQDFSSGSKGTVTYNIGDFGTGSFNNNGTIKFSDNTLDGTYNNALINVESFYNNANGIINLTGKNPLGSNTLAGDTLTINGNYISNGGSIYINSLLDDATSNGGKGTSDLLIVDGNVTTGAGGPTHVYITPTSNSLGQLTTGKGIQITNISGTSSSDAFALGRPLTAGAYEYQLGRYNNTDPNWYLSSYYNPTGGGGSTGKIMYSPSIGAYLANQTAAVEMFQQTLHDRLISSSDFDQDATKKLFWLRTSMTHGSRRSVNASFSNRNRSYMMQLGADLGVWQLNNGYLHLGLMAGYGDAKNTSTSRLTRTEADGKIKGYSTGIYGTWFQNQDTNLGLYIDTWSQMGWYRNEVSGKAQLSTKKYNSTVWSNSIEAGYGLSLGKTSQHQWIATPQLQLTYNSYDADNQTDKNKLHVSRNQASGLQTRTGIRLHGRGLQKQTIQPFIEINWLHTTAKNQLHFNGQKLRDGLPQNRFESKIGLQGDINDKWSVSAQVGGQWGQNHFNQYQGQLNINYKW